MEEKVITLSAYSNVTEATIVSQRLANAGIESYVVDSNAYLSDAVSGPGYGGVKLNIRAEDFEKALIIIQSENNISEQFIN